MTRHDEIRASYRKLGNSADFYDGIITRSTLIGKLVDSVVWGRILYRRHKPPSPFTFRLSPFCGRIAA